MAQPSEPKIEKPPRWPWIILVGLVLILTISALPWSKIKSEIQDFASIKQQENYPPCAGANDYYLYPNDPEQYMEIPTDPNCWSGWITTPAGSDYYLQSTTEHGFEMLFLDGYRIYLTPKDPIWFGQRRGIFRLRGESAVIVTIEYN